MSLPVRKHIMLVDGNNLAYRYNSVLELTGPRGQRVSAIYGVITALLQWRKSLRYYDTSVYYFWDKGHSAARKELYPDYKKRSPKADEDKARYESFIEQCNLLQDLLPALNANVIFGEGMECDDLLAHWSSIYEEYEDMRVDIVSGDSDYLQLVGPTVRILTAKGEFVTVSSVQEKYGVEPCHMAAWKALVGDASDNIPGVAGIGEKRATWLLQAFPSLAELKPPSKVEREGNKYTPLLKKVLADWEVFDRNVALITLPSQLVKIDLKQVEWRKPKPDKEKVRAAFRELAFVQLLTKFNENWAYWMGEMRKDEKHEED